MENILKRIISDFHVNWIPEFKARDVRVPLDLNKVISIVGPRRAGKTYFLYQLMATLEARGVSKKRILYINFEDERLDLEGRHDLIFEAWLSLYPDLDLSSCWFFFDEIQELDRWEKFIRRVYDTFSRNIFITGSNARVLSREIASALRGRSLPFEIMPLSFKEFLFFKGIDPEDRHSLKNSTRIQNAFEEYLIWGGYPELVGMAPRFKSNILQEYFNVMLYRDLVERYGIRDLSLLKYLIKRLIGSYTKEFSVNKMYNDLKSRGFSIGKDRIYGLMEEIFSIYMLARVEKFEPSVVKREMSNKKVYLHDNGFASAIHGSFFEDRGKLLENLVFTHLRGRTENIHFLKNGWECDFAVFPDLAKPLLIQVTEKLDDHNLKREIKGLEAARKRVPGAECLVLVRELARKVSVPDWTEVVPVLSWVLMPGFSDQNENRENFEP